jgi:transcriptional regulator with XRE-family HTH domain
METTFGDWLTKKMEEREWSQADLARASGLTRQAIGYYLGPKSKRPDEEALKLIAKAFKVPIEQAYRAAGILPPEKKRKETIEEIEHALDDLSEGELQEFLSYVRWRTNNKK